MIHGERMQGLGQAQLGHLLTVTKMVLVIELAKESGNLGTNNLSIDRALLCGTRRVVLWSEGLTFDCLFD